MENKSCNVSIGSNQIFDQIESHHGGEARCYERGHAVNIANLSINHDNLAVALRDAVY